MNAIKRFFRFIFLFFQYLIATVNTLVALAVIAAVAGYLWLGTLDVPDISMPEASRTYDENPAPVPLTPNLDIATSTVAPGLTAAERTNRMLRATVLVSNVGYSIGSGVIIDNKACYVVTNEHVIDAPGKLILTYITGFRADGSAIKVEEPAEIVGLPTADDDLALLKMAHCDGTIWAPLGDSDVLRHGDVVTAIGHPKGQLWSLSKGIVSQPRREMKDATDISGWELIQTDAALNPGNSGGPLFDSEGQVVGINSLILRDSDNLGYARPSNLVKVYLAYLQDSGKMPKILLGVMVSPLSGKTATELGVPAGRIASGDFGLKVIDVAEGGVAALMGVKADDVILSVNGGGVYDVNRFKRLLYTHALDEVLELTVLRDGELMVLRTN
jgi:serine protease Do